MECVTLLITSVQNQRSSSNYKDDVMKKNAWRSLARELVSIVGSLRDRESACSASDRQGLNFESCVWRTVSSHSSHHPQEVLLAQFSLYVHKGGLKPDSFHLLLISLIQEVETAMEERHTGLVNLHTSQLPTRCSCCHELGEHSHQQRNSAWPCHNPLHKWNHHTESCTA